MSDADLLSLTCCYCCCFKLGQLGRLSDWFGINKASWSLIVTWGSLRVVSDVMWRKYLLLVSDQWPWGGSADSSDGQRQERGWRGRPRSHGGKVSCSPRPPHPPLCSFCPTCAQRSNTSVTADLCTSASEYLLFVTECRRSDWRPPV